MKLVISPEYENLVPKLQELEYNSLKESIQKNGLWMPVVVNPEGVILDGHHRLKICKELGKPVKFTIEKFETKSQEIIFVGESNLERRQLTALQRIILVRKLEPHYAELAKNRMLSGKKSDPKIIKPEGQVRDILGKKANVSGSTYEKGITILDNASPETIEKINNGTITINKVFKIMKKDEKKQERHNALMTQQVNLPETIQLHNMEFQKLKIAPGSVSLIITDPPYHDKFLHLFKDLAKQSSHVLRDGGSLVTYVGQKNIGKVINMMEAQGLEFHWPLTIKHSGPSASVFGLKVLVACKIMLWFTKGKYEGEFVRDFIESEFQGKELHEWQQSTKESDYYIKYMTIENEIVYDPFLGSGTFGISAKKLKRQFIGCEVDKDHYETARRLISNV